MPDRETRQLTETQLDFVSHHALVVGSPVSRVMASVFIRIHEPKFPCRVFTDEARAELWLREVGYGDDTSAATGLLGNATGSRHRTVSLHDIRVAPCR